MRGAVTAPKNGVECRKSENNLGEPTPTDASEYMTDSSEESDIDEEGGKTISSK